jgi:hypothetical protein
LALNTTKNIQQTVRDPIGTVNNRWSEMMDNVPQVKKQKRNISFNENVTCHSILRIQDLIAEYDAFDDMETEIPNETEKTQNEIKLIDMTMKEMNEACPKSSFDDLSDSFQPLKRRKSVIWDDNDSVTSLGPGFRTPERACSPGISTILDDVVKAHEPETTNKNLYSRFSNQALHAKDHLKELEQLFYADRYQHIMYQEKPIVSLSPKPKKITL